MIRFTLLTSLILSSLTALADMDTPEYENTSACKMAIQKELAAEANLANLESDLKKQNLINVEALNKAKTDLDIKRRLTNSTCGA